MPDDLSERVLSIIASTQRVPRENVTLDSSFAELGFDSLDAMNILFALESEFNISIPDHAARAIKNVRDAVNGVEQLLREQAPADGSSSTSPPSNSVPEAGRTT